MALTRQRPLKDGASEGYEEPFDRNVDAVDTRGVALQNDVSNDAAVLIERDASDNMTFKDPVLGATKTLSQLAQLGAANVGRATVNFGAFPGSNEAEVAVTGQTGILATSKVQAWIDLETTTADHSKDEHRLENLKITAGTIIAGTGFTIYVEVQNPTGKYDVADGNRAYGQWSICWSWV